jgi:hypothetical protein
MVSGDMPVYRLTGFQLFDRGATLFEEDPVPAVRTTDIDVDLNFLLAPCAFVGTCHGQIPFIS